MKRCAVTYATPDRQWTWTVEMPDGGTVADALRLAREQARDVAVPWDADVGIFGELCDSSAVPREGDRIEIYRPLRLDPKESRRARVRAARAVRDPEPSRPPKPE